MRKIYFVMVVSFLVVSISASAQEKIEQPPPPPKPKVIVDKRFNMSKPKEPPVITVTSDLADEFYKRSPSVESVSRKENITSIKKKDGTTEKYDMSKKEEGKSFTEKYGRSPIPPPPPPKPKKEIIKYKVVDEKIKKPSPPKQKT